MTRYEFDRDSFSFRKVTTSIGTLLWRVFKWIVASFSLAACIYVIVSLFISTDTERKLLRQNRQYEKLYGEMLERRRLLSDEIEGLQMRDDAIYEEIFHTPAPAPDPVEEMTPTDTVRGVAATLAKVGVLSEKAASVDGNFMRIFDLLCDVDVPPMDIPLENLTYAQIGAGTGSRLSPFYKVAVAHDGLDLVAAQGDAVLATADGVVQEVRRSGKGLGNVVEIAHAGGYVTRYCHLGDIYVTKGQRIARGKKIGLVGMSGNSFAPHLHYEVRKADKVLDPVQHLFAKAGPREYAAIAYMASVTEQSLD